MFLLDSAAGFSLWVLLSKAAEYALAADGRQWGVRYR